MQRKTHRRLSPKQNRIGKVYVVMLAAIVIVSFTVILTRTRSIVNKERERVVNMKIAAPGEYAGGYENKETVPTELPPPLPTPEAKPYTEPEPEQEPEPEPEPPRRDNNNNKNKNTEDNAKDNIKEDQFGPDEERRDAVRAAMRHAWAGYKKYAWGMDEVDPVHHAGTNWLGAGLGATIIDSLDTLWIMNMEDEFYEARDWVRDNFNPRINADVSFFETTIRILGGLLSAYGLSGDSVFLENARDVGDGLIRAIKPPNAMPYLQVNLNTGEASSPSWASGKTNIAEAGTVQLEFLYLSEAIGDSSYGEKALAVLDKIWDSNRDRKGLLPVDIRVSDGRCVSGPLKFGATGDSFYEYLLKLYFFLGGEANPKARKYRDMFNTSMRSLLDKLVLKTADSGLTYIAEYEHGRIRHKMDHLVCFAGAMLAIGGAKAFKDFNAEYFEAGEEITRTCHEFYARMPSGLAPEVVVFPDGKGLKSGAGHNLLRPETVESYFVLWRLTHDKKYRDWGWEMFQAFEKHCKTEGGYAGLDNVVLKNPNKVSSMPSYFLAETLKYFYLLYSEDSLISLDDYVFNTEAHPFPVKGARRP